MPDETQKDRDLRALDESQQRPCGLCCSAPRAPGDHLCRRCRKRLNDARNDYEAKATKLIDEEASRDEAAESKGDSVREGDRERGPGGRPRCP